MPAADPGGPYPGVEGTAVTFDGTGSDDQDGDALTYYWTFGDGDDGVGPTPSHTYRDNGSYPVTLRVTDSKGAVSAVASTNATIANVAPSFTSVTLAPDPVPVGSTVGLSGSFSDPSDLDTHGVTVNWDDGGGDQPATVIQGAGSGTFSANQTITVAGAGRTLLARIRIDDPRDRDLGLGRGQLADPVGSSAPGSADG